MAIIYLLSIFIFSTDLWGSSASNGLADFQKKKAEIMQTIKTINKNLKILKHGCEACASRSCTKKACESNAPHLREFQATLTDSFLNPNIQDFAKWEKEFEAEFRTFETVVFERAPDNLAAADIGRGAQNVLKENLEKKKSALEGLKEKIKTPIQGLQNKIGSIYKSMNPNEKKAYWNAAVDCWAKFNPAHSKYSETNYSALKGTGIFSLGVTNEDKEKFPNGPYKMLLGAFTEDSEDSTTKNCGDAPKTAFLDFAGQDENGKNGKLKLLKKQLDELDKYTKEKIAAITAELKNLDSGPSLASVVPQAATKPAPSTVAQAAPAAKPPTTAAATTQTSVANTKAASPTPTVNTGAAGAAGAALAATQVPGTAVVDNTITPTNLEEPLDPDAPAHKASADLFLRQPAATDTSGTPVNPPEPSPSAGPTAAASESPMGPPNLEQLKASPAAKYQGPIDYKEMDEYQKNVSMDVPNWKENASKWAQSNSVPVGYKNAAQSDPVAYQAAINEAYADLHTSSNGKYPYVYQDGVIGPRTKGATVDLMKTDKGKQALEKALKSRGLIK